jgi:uncharacterized alkaline shock family protein YloU
MNENQMLEMNEDSSLGKVEIAPEVIEVIASLAASEVQGVSELRGNFVSGVAERFGRKVHRKGVKVDLHEDGIDIDIYVVLEYGISIPEVGQHIQDNIRQQMLTMTALEPLSINVNIVGIQFKQEQQDVEEIL